MVPIELFKPTQEIAYWCLQPLSKWVPMDDRDQSQICVLQ
jgi:hypothetical protein